MFSKVNVSKYDLDSLKLPKNPQTQLSIALTVENK